MTTLKDFLDGLHTRFTNPLVSTFAVAVVLVNWEPIAVIALSSEDIVKRIAYVKLTYSSWTRWGIIPAGLAVAYVALIPIVSAYVGIYHRFIESFRAIQEARQNARAELERVRIAAELERATQTLSNEQRAETLRELEQTIENKKLQLIALDEDRALDHRLQRMRKLAASGEADLRASLTDTERDQLRRTLELLDRFPPKRDD